MADSDLCPKRRAPPRHWLRVAARHATSSACASASSPSRVHGEWSLQDGRAVNLMHTTSGSAYQLLEAASAFCCLAQLLAFSLLFRAVRTVKSMHRRALIIALLYCISASAACVVTHSAVAVSVSLAVALTLALSMVHRFKAYTIARHAFLTNLILTNLVGIGWIFYGLFIMLPSSEGLS